MIGEIWDSIVDGISMGWEAITSLPEQFSGLFSEVNFIGFFILSMIGEITLWGFWYYSVYLKGVKHFFDIKIMLIATILTPVICYIFAWKAARQ